ncbi:MAG: ABC transporter permease [Prolixibacteraceae bacterium]|nr:ABC transporter permease [Prolixibacteraceae bacterium]
MIKHFLITAWRNLKRNRLLSVIQIFCLTIGLATFILIFRYIQYEKNWDRFNSNFEQVYRAQEHEKDGSGQGITQTDPMLAGFLKENYPEVEEAIVMREVWGGYLSTSPDRTYYEEQGFYAPSEVFDVFSFELLTGNPKNALDDPDAAILSQSLAKKYFPFENPIGKTIKDDENRVFKITGIMKDIPEDSHIRPDYFLSIASRPKWEMTSWDNKSFRTYVLLQEGVDVNQFNSHIKSLLDQHNESNKCYLYLKPMSELHLTPNDTKDLLAVIIFYSIIGVLILVLASLNFANLTTAFSISRAKEIGVRKVNGSGVGSLRKQFLSESILIAFLSLIFAVIVAWLCLPFFNNIVERNLTLNFLSNPVFVIVVLGATLVTGFVSGIYPSFLLSAFRPVVILKGSNPLAKTRGRISGLKALVTVQFALTVILIASTVWIYRQTMFLKNTNLGFDKSALFHCSIPDNSTQKEFRELRQQALRIQGVENMAISKNSPFHSNWGRGVSLEGAASDDWINFNYNEVSPEYLETYGFTMAEGRFFSETQKSDEKACVINEAGAKNFGGESAINKRLIVNGELHTVIGVIKDFHTNSVMFSIDPFIMLQNRGQLKEYNEYTIKLDGSNNQAAIASLDNLFRENFPNSIFTISYFDDRADMTDVQIWQSVGRTFIFFTILAILIAGMGLFGLVAYTTRKKIKEIGVRRVQGATSSNIFVLVVKEFLLLLFIANLFVVPIPYILKNTTPGYYKYNMEIWEIIAVIAFTFIIALISSSYEAIKAANLNPVKSLRYE